LSTFIENFIPNHRKKYFASNNKKYVYISQHLKNRFRKYLKSLILLVMIELINFDRFQQSVIELKYLLKQNNRIMFLSKLNLWSLSSFDWNTFKKITQLIISNSNDIYHFDLWVAWANVFKVRPGLARGMKEQTGWAMEVFVDERRN
jgi:hypothetical protein